MVGRFFEILTPSTFILSETQVESVRYYKKLGSIMSTIMMDLIVEKKQLRQKRSTQILSTFVHNAANLEKGLV